MDGDYGTDQLAMVRSTFAGDEVVLQKLDSFIQRMQRAGSDILAFFGEDNSGVTSGGKVDLQDDGTTRVLHVSHKEIDLDDPAARNFGGNMEMTEREQKKQFEVARQMAVMQQDILAELLSWDETERKEQLEFCRQVRNEFVQQAMTVNPEERAAFMTTVNPDLQRKLIMLKLWDEMVARNGGKEPEIKKAKGANPPVEKETGGQGIQR